ncbi:MAG: ABC-F family ATP-binding cassette domain-containing protein [Anaerolineae bacterium]|nr:ABC-F family ATP-binding cassette domain-containing protein [Anaerolineae bacterium]
MLHSNQISKSYSLLTVLERVSFGVQPGERLGLVGPNGCGKTTLLRILAGVEAPDGGDVRRMPADLRLGYLAQGFEFAPGERLVDFIARQQGDLDALGVRLEDLARQLAATPGRDDLQREYDRVLACMAQASESAGRAPALLAGLGLAQVTPETPVAHLSGGQKTRLALAGVLLASPQVLLLDEPTNHLDFDMLAWLEDWLLGFDGAVLVVSHDRVFLDHVASAILELDPRTRGLRRFEGGYSNYLEHKAAEFEQQRQAYQGQLEEIAQLRQAANRLRGIAAFRKGGKGDSGDKFASGFFANRTQGTLGRAKNIERRLQKLSEQRMEKPRPAWQMRVDFGEVPESGRAVIVMEDLAVGYGGQALLEGLNGAVWHGARVALTGPNGSGKTTLLRTMAGLIPPLAGSVRLGAGVRPGYMAQEQEELDGGLNPLQTIQRAAGGNETEARSFLSKYLFTGDDVFVPVGSLSFGERARLSLACLVGQGCNLLLLDEPLNHLDIPSRARFEAALADFPGTVLAVVHDRYFIAGFASQVWQVQGRGLAFAVGLDGQ